VQRRRPFLDVFHHVDQHLGRAQIGMRDDHLALGDLAAPSVDRHDDLSSSASANSAGRLFALRTPKLPDGSFLKGVCSGGSCGPTLSLSSHTPRPFL
jgi:hypothetical protein